MGLEQKPLVPIGVIVAVALLVVFGLLGLLAHDAGAGNAVDHAVLGWLVAHRAPALTTVAVAITTAGSPPVITALAALAAAVLWWRRRVLLPPLVVLGTLAAATSVSTLTKIAVGSHRPSRVLQLVPELDMSYPSGHVTGTLALAGIVAVAVGCGRPRWTQVLLAVSVAVVTVLVALTRLYLGLHWLTDICGGMLLGSAAVLLGSAVPGFGAPSPLRERHPIAAKTPMSTARMK